jgi:hypothetical protein
MRQNKFVMLPLFALAVLISLFSACSKNHFNINKNPNLPTDSTVSYDVILSAALNSTGEVVAGDWGWLQNWMGYWARSGSYAPSLTEETYNITTIFQNNVWNNLYNNNYDYQVMQQKATAAGARFYEGIARIMKAHNYQVLVDVYNNVPYSEALKGNSNITPKYDKALDVYKDLFRQIDTGIALIKAATATQSKDIATNDVLFAGNKTKWAKFGNTLRLRMLVHLHNGVTATQVAPGIDVAAEVAIIKSEGSGFIGTGETAQVQPGYRSDKPNPFYRVYVADETNTATFGSAYYRANKWGLEYYAYNADPREAAFYSALSTGYRGVEYGLPAANQNSGDKLSGIGPGLNKGSGMAQWILTATESLFLQAEAKQRGILTDGLSAKAYWTEAIKENFVWLGGTATAAQNFINANAGTGFPDVDFDADPLYAILSQKWFSLNGIATYEVWTDYRRTDIVYGAAAGYDPGPPVSVAPQNTSRKIPSRLLYPQTEFNYNAANVTKEQNADRYGKIFWDLN